MKVGGRVFSTKAQMAGTVVGPLSPIWPGSTAEGIKVVDVSLDQMDLFLDNCPVWFYGKGLGAI